ncbi:hypothetical protein DOE73_10550 [Paenibacillus dendritiformis]|nr:hypothetical protein DOE73_10550 [Paenibacillus dendritiformis]
MPSFDLVITPPKKTGVFQQPEIYSNYRAFLLKLGFWRKKDVHLQELYLPAPNWGRILHHSRNWALHRGHYMNPLPVGDYRIRHITHEGLSPAL